MNIFALDYSPKLAAQYHCDKHVVKMIVETAQILSTAHHINGVNSQLREIIYKETHKNHPCCIWARESTENYLWLCSLGIELCKEYTLRYGKIHKTQSILEMLVGNIPNFKYVCFTPFALAMPEDCWKEDAVLAYRKYYMVHKRGICTWKTKKPIWFI